MLQQDLTALPPDVRRELRRAARPNKKLLGLRPLVRALPWIRQGVKQGRSPNL